MGEIAAIQGFDYSWTPHPGPQTEFCERGEYEVLFGGAAGPGKTDCLLMESSRGTWHPRYRGLILRRTFPQLQEIIDRAFTWFPLIDQGAYYKATEHRWYFTGGATIQLGHMQHELDKYNYQGKEFHWIGFDELTQFTSDQYLYLHSRCRSTIAEIKPQIRATTNPGGIGHLWVKERFIDVAKPLETYIDPNTGLSRAFVPASVYDNPTLVNNDPLYVKRLEALPEVERKRLLDGSWEVFAGQAFPELSTRVHGCDPFAIPPEWEKYCSFDWGYSHPWGCLWLAMDFDGVLYVYREVYGGKKTNSGEYTGVRQTNQEMCSAILDAEKEKLRFRVADPACWGPTKVQGRNDLLGPSFAEDASKQGLYFMKADNDRLRGRAQLHQRLAVHEIEDSAGNVIGEQPNLVIFKDCQHLWRTMQLLREKERNPEDVDKNQEDHLYDCLRYGVMARPMRPKKKVSEAPGSFAAERKKYIRAKNRARREGTSLEVAYRRGNR